MCLPMLVTITPAPCLRASFIIISAIASEFLSSRWLMGSSAKMKSNGCTRALIIATLCCWPNDILPTLLSSLSDIPNFSNHSLISFSVLNLVMSFFICTFSHAVSSGNSLSSWNRNAICFLRISVQSFTLNSEVMALSNLTVPS